jgi:signal transduction histidine kinase
VKPTKKTTERFDALEYEITRLNRLIDGLLALGRAGANQESRVRIDATTVVRERVASWQKLADESGSMVSLEADEAVAIWAVESALENIIDVYLDNALSLSPAGSQIDVRLTAEGSHVALSVCDQGPGLSSQESERAFDRFWRGSQSYEGSGLGLAIVKQMADASNAEVSLTARDVGGAEARAVFQKPSS